MIYNEEDIDFMVLSDRRFEELCFDLLLRRGYRGLMWRQGGPDNGRDIEGFLSITYPIIDSYEEKWFFECKRYREGVPVTEITSKFAWADAERPKHIVIIVSSHLSNSTREWISKISSQKPYAVHLIEGKKLKQILLAYPELISEYFLDKYFKLLLDSQKNWLVHNLLPEPATLHILAANLNPNKLTGSDMAFLLCSVLLGDEDIQSWCEINEYFNMDHLFANLKNHSNTTKPLIEQIGNCETEKWCCCNSQAVAAYGNSGSVITWKKCFITSLVLTDHEEQRRALYLGFEINKDEGVEILIELKGGFPVRIRHVIDENEPFDKWETYLYNLKKRLL